MAYWMAVGSNLFFGVAAVYYSLFARKNSVLWMNLTKSGVALIFSAVFAIALGGFAQITLSQALPFFGSGAVGLGLGDFFMFLAFLRIGASRTLMLWGFQPVVVGIGCYFLFGDLLSIYKILAIVFLVLCLLVFSYEGFRKKGHWEIQGLIFAMTGVILDSGSSVATKWAFEQSPLISPIQGLVFRSSGAVIVLLVLYGAKIHNYFVGWQSLTNKDRALALAVSFFGTFVALLLSLSAIKIGHLPSLAAIGVTCPLFTGVFEHAIERRWPSRLFLLATGFFILGFTVLLMSDYY
jgi:drug/metabolite transporter (DMT)-like permease